MIIQKFTPKNKCIMVLRDPSAEDKQTDSGLFIPGRAVELANQGEVRAADTDSQYKAGDRVVFTKYAGSEFTLNGVLYILLPEKDIQGTVTDVEVPDSVFTPVGEDVNAAAQKALALLAATAENAR